MAEAQEPIQDIAHLGHVELLSPKPDESLWFFKEVLGMEEANRQGQSVYLRAYGDYDSNTLKLTEARNAGLGHTGWRTASLQALERRVQALEKSGLGKGWTEGDVGHGPGYQFEDPDGHLMEVYYESQKYRAPEGSGPALKNQPQKYPARGVSVRRLDHINVLCQEVTRNREFMEEYLGFKLRENVVLDDGTEAGAWISVTPLAHDIAYTLDATNSHGRLHHVAYWCDNREDLLRAADIFLENGIYIETGPSKHAVTQGFFLYVYEPGGNRIEIFSGGYLIFAPDWEPVTWTQAERAKGQAWNLRLPESFHTYGTPVADAATETKEIPVFDPV
ncbi:MAG: catechol 2,3-dioxygenase [Rubrobacteraceae bacterium]|nr:catechol 2,3-dioxygenase [Rubrobacteraceae bacterium]